MSAITTIAKATLIAALLGVAAGCDRSAPDQTSGGSATTPASGTAGSSGSSAGASQGASASGGSGSSTGAAIDDSIITTKVKTALLADAEIKGSDISVETRQGEVLLAGFVTNQKQVQKAVQVAGAVEGVKKVNNKMTVKQ